ncbi:hypothetical protein ACI2KR_26970 [Pseudomonas luteola]
MSEYIDNEEFALWVQEKWVTFKTARVRRSKERPYLMDQLTFEMLISVSYRVKCGSKTLYEGPCFLKAKDTYNARLDKFGLKAAEGE